MPRKRGEQTSTFWNYLLDMIPRKLKRSGQSSKGRLRLNCSNCWIQQNQLSMTVPQQSLREITTQQPPSYQDHETSLWASAGWKNGQQEQF